MSRHLPQLATAFLLAGFLFLTGCGNVRPWTKTELALAGTALLVMCIDWGQTRDIKNHPGYHEVNKILGKHPTDQRINLYFPITIALGGLIAHYGPDGLAYVMPGPWQEPVRKWFRSAWLGGWTVNEAYWIKRNYDLGIKPSW